MNPESLERIDKKWLARRWGVALRSVERIRQRYGLKPTNYFGRQPEFSLADVKDLERRRKKDRTATLSRLANQRKK